jgi:SAM-dependent methyltransferase
MKPLSSCALVDLSIDLGWKHNQIAHQENYFVKDFNCWRDALPGSPFTKLLENNQTSKLSLDVHPGTLVPKYDPDKIIELPQSRLNIQDLDTLRKGRFYPQGILSGIPGIFRETMTPFRCLDLSSKGIMADLNHPMAKFPFTMSLQILNRSMGSEERGGACTDWMGQALTGPGMQTGFNEEQTDFLSRDAFDRRDNAMDTLFYSQDRQVRHIDARASKTLSDLYKRQIAPGATILDLMSGLDSHLPDDLDLQKVHGLGLNKNELKANRQLTDFSIQDLNANPHLPFQDQAFDTVICALSVEYLVNPVAVFNDVSRVLRPNGKFIVSFSNRMFPEKAIRIWEDLHEFERMGLIIDYYKQSKGWGLISTLSQRGYPRPVEDRYYHKLRYSDPVYAIMGTKA